MTDIKKICLTNFINQLNGFLNDLLIILPGNEGIISAKKYVDTLSKINPKLLLSLWYESVTEKYNRQINEGDLDFALNKDYSEEVIGKSENSAESSSSILLIIDNLKTATKKLDEDQENNNKIFTKYYSTYPALLSINNIKKNQEYGVLMNIVKFNKIALDFVNDIDLVFPEYKVFENDIYRRLRDSELENTDGEIYTYCKKLYPKHFFDILYKNDNLFDDNIYLIPEINFKNVWESDTSKETKSKIWQYLQLLLMCITEQMDNSSDFGDATQLFDLLDENEFKKKLAETFEELSETFTRDLSGVQFDKDVKDVSSNNNFDNFNPESIHEHLSSLMNGKIGCLAKEIAGDTLNDLDIDPSNGNTQEVFESLIKDPTKLMSLMKKIGDKIENKIKKGEINQEELMSKRPSCLKI